MEADLALREGSFSVAQAAWKRASELDPSNPAPHAMAGRYYWMTRRFREAAVSFELASARDPNNVELLLAWIQALKDAGDHTRIESLSRRAVALAPENPKALVYLGEHLAFVAGSMEAQTEALEILERAAALAPYMPLPHLHLGRALLGTKDYEAAEARLSTAWRLLHEGERPLMQLDSMAHVERRRAEAAYALAAAADAQGKKADAHRWRGRFREVDARIENRSHWSFGALRNPPDIESVVKLARMDRQIGGVVESRRLVEEALRRRPGDPRLLALRSELARAAK